MIFKKDEIPSHKTHEQPFMYNLRLNRLHVNLKLINNLNISYRKYGLYLITCITKKKITLCHLPSAVAGFRLLLCSNIIVCMDQRGGSQGSTPSSPHEKLRLITPPPPRKHNYMYFSEPIPLLMDEYTSEYFDNDSLYMLLPQRRL